MLSIKHDQGGFGFTPGGIGFLQSFGAYGSMFGAVAFYERVVSACGPHRAFFYGWIVNIVPWCISPSYVLVTDPKYGYWRDIILAIHQFIHALGNSLLMTTAVEKA